MTLFLQVSAGFREQEQVRAEHLLNVKGSLVQVSEGSIVGRGQRRTRCATLVPPFGGFSRYRPSAQGPSGQTRAVRPDWPLILHFSSEELRDHPSSRGTVDARNEVDGGDRHRSAGVPRDSPRESQRRGAGSLAMRRSGVRIPSAPPKSPGQGPCPSFCNRRTEWQFRTYSALMAPTRSIHRGFSESLDRPPWGWRTC